MTIPAQPGGMRIRMVTYNIHKCRGMDRKTRPERIARVLRGINADVIGLQEVLDVRDGPAELDQARAIMSGMPDYYWQFGETRPLHGGSYGNMTLSRFPIETFASEALTHSKREPRGFLRTDLTIAPGRKVRAINLHLGTGFLERRHQVRYLLDLLQASPAPGPHAVFGDFNEWTRGLASQRLARHFHTFEPRTMLERARTYPGFLPILHLDHFYYDPELKLDRMHLVRTRETLLASDHLPLVADFKILLNQ